MKGVRGHRPWCLSTDKGGRKKAWLTGGRRSGNKGGEYKGKDTKSLLGASRAVGELKTRDQKGNGEGGRDRWRDEA